MAEKQLTKAEVAEHVEALKAGLAPKMAIQGAPMPVVIPDEGLEAVVKAGRPMGMPIGTWIQIVLSILQTIQPFLPKKPTA